VLKDHLAHAHGSNAHRRRGWCRQQRRPQADGGGGASRGVTRKALSDLLNGHSGVSPEMAIRLEKAGWTTADHWLRMQLQYDLWHARQRAASIKVTRFPVPDALAPPLKPGRRPAMRPAPARETASVRR
jgi:hypothetical protein